MFSEKQINFELRIPQDQIVETNLKEAIVLFFAQQT